MDGNPCGGHIVVNSEFRLGWLSKCYQWINFLGLKNHWKSTILALGFIPTTWGSITLAWTMVGERVAATLGLISENVAFDGSLLKWKSLKYWKQHTGQQPSGCPFPFFIPFIHFDMLITGRKSRRLVSFYPRWNDLVANVEVSKTRAEDEVEKNAVALLESRWTWWWHPTGLFSPPKKGEVKKKGCGG